MAHTPVGHDIVFWIIFIAIGRRDPDRNARITGFYNSRAWADSEVAEKRGQEKLKVIFTAVPIAILLFVLQWTIPVLSRASSVLGPAGAGSIVVAIALLLAYRLRKLEVRPRKRKAVPTD